jgi:uncharacterized protein
VYDQRYLGIEKSGYEPLLQYGNTLLWDRVLFGSGFPSLPLERSQAEIEALPLTETTRRKWLGENAARFLNL